MKAIITGVNGQDGSYMADLLLSKGYNVLGLIKDSQSNSISISSLLNNKKFTIKCVNLLNSKEIDILLSNFCPDEIYHYAAQSSPILSFQLSYKSYLFNTNSTYILLNAILQSTQSIKFFFASSSEVFRKGNKNPQNEECNMLPKSPYGLSKKIGLDIVEFFRLNHGIFACSAISFNHESPRRNPLFISRKISIAVNKIYKKEIKFLKLRNIDGKRDWGYAPDYVETNWKMLQQNSPVDYVIGTGRIRTVKEMLDVAFSCMELDWKKYVISDELSDESSTEIIYADTSKIKKKIGFKPSISFEEMIKLMVINDGNIKKI